MRRLTLLLAIFLLFPAFASAQEFEKNIMTGGPSGTYIQIGRDLANLESECGLTLNVLETGGSLENFVGVRKRAHTQFGIVQSDVLDYFKTFQANDPEVQRAISGVRIMFPLYNEEVHILAKREITSLADLSGRKVAVGNKGSGTYLTSSLILDIMQLRNVERIATPAKDALARLKNGEIDAMIYIAGVPTKLFADTSIDGARFHLLPINEPLLQASYVSANIKAGTYPFQTEEVNVIAVKAVMMTYEYRIQKNRYQKESCKAVSDLSNLMLTNLTRLKAEGHPKWKNVDLAAIPPGWQVGNCVKTGMAANYKLQCSKPLTRTVRQQSAGNDEYLKLLKAQLKK
ncbi:MAG: C4-dicarboxylate ABC transporter substrate-binding protein [Hyphomicrobiales bacterium]|nr:MAG: C4-dicarboxylate ABC transporter substrate-binding protein [Hyphomicrobiales bacterium]